MYVVDIKLVNPVIRREFYTMFLYKHYDNKYFRIQQPYSKTLVRQ